MNVFRKLHRLSTLEIFAIVLATVFFVQSAWGLSPLSHRIHNDPSPIVKVEVSENPHLPPSPLGQDSPKTPKPQDDVKTPPVIDPPIIDPEMAIPPPLTDPEMVVKPDSTKPSPEDHTQEEMPQESVSGPK